MGLTPRYLRRVKRVYSWIMDTSVFLARVIGLLGVISTAAVLVRYKESLAFEEKLVQNPANIYLSGFFILILGVLLVVSHPVWALDWRIVITILGWLVLLKGLMRIFFPETVRRLIQKKQGNRWFILGELMMLLVGFYLLYHGFIVY